MKFYHISSEHLGINPVLEPRVPRSSLIQEEGDIPRICVAPTLYFCVRSIIGCNPINQWDVLVQFKTGIEGFETNAEFIQKGKTIDYPIVYTPCATPYLPPNSSDFRENKEHWFLEKTEFFFVGYLDLEHMLDNGKFKLTDNRKSINSSILLNESLKKKNIRKHG